MGIDLVALRIRIADALSALRDDQLSMVDRLTASEALLALALLESGELSEEEIEYWLARPGVAAALAREAGEER
jgi:hypothetical protein